MIAKIGRYYFDSFKNIQIEVWYLALITLINRAGTMVIPFLSLYLSAYLGFSFSQVGWIMMFFGAGSVVGSWLGGKLTDRFGFYRVLYMSLGLTGLLFILLQFLTSFYAFGFGVFFIMLVADTFRPALFVALKSYSREENQTRSVTLIRLAINLGFSMGPALGGLIITLWSYQGLFWVDGISCLMAVFVFLRLIKEKPRKAISTINTEVDTPVAINPLSDRKYLLFLMVCFLMGFVFMQVFSTVPVYYRDVFMLNEAQIGLLLAANGLLIFVFEMPLVKELEIRKIPKIKIIQYATLLISVSYLVFNFSQSAFAVLVINILLLTLGEMLGFPFTNVIAMDAAPKGFEGQYLAYYTMSFSLAHLFSAKFGFTLIDKIGFANTWYVISLLGFVSFILAFLLSKLNKADTIKK